MISKHPLPLLMLSLGQLLNALMPLMLYTAGWLMTKRRDVGLVAAFLVAFPFLFPAYYATWGRFTQLTGMLIMCVLVAMTWRLMRSQTKNGPHPPTADASPNTSSSKMAPPLPLSHSPTLPLSPSPRRKRASGWGIEPAGVPVRAIFVGLLAAGLFLVHLRVFIFYLPFAFVLWLYNRGERTISLGAAALFGGLLVAPRIFYLKPPAVGNVFNYKIAGYNAFPTGYVTAGWEKYFIIAAGISVLIVLIGRLRRTRWSTLPLVLLLWVAMLFLLLGGEYVGLPESWVVNLNSMYITLFLPLALLLGITSTYLWRYRVFLRRLSLPYRTIVSSILHASLGALVMALLLFGIRHQITILNEQTILAYPDDLPALEWVDQNTPPSARFAVSSWLWLGNTWAGQDAGSWLVPLTGRYSSTPPADYVYNLSLHADVAAFNDAAKAIKDWSDPSAALWLKELGMTHIFIGAKPSRYTFSLDPAKLKANPALIERYSRNGAFVFEIK